MPWCYHSGPHTRSRTNLCSSTLVACCCQPTLGRLGSGSSSRAGGLSASSCQCGISNPASRTACWHCRSEWKQATGSSPSKPATMRSARLLRAPKWIKRELLQERWGCPRSGKIMVHTLSSWRLANVSVSAGLRARSQKLALVAPHMRRSRNAAWVSLTQCARRGVVVRQIWSPRKPRTARVKASTPLGSVPPLFQTCVLLWFRWMRQRVTCRLWLG